MEIQLFLLVKVWLRYVSLLAWVIACKILLSHVGNIFHDLIFPHKSLFRFAFRYLFTCCFCWIKALMAHLCHGSAMECRIRGGDDSGPGRNGRRPGETKTHAARAPPQFMKPSFASQRPVAVNNFRGQLNVLPVTTPTRPEWKSASGYWR